MVEVFGLARAVNSFKKHIQPKVLTKDENDTSKKLGIIIHNLLNPNILCIGVYREPSHFFNNPRPSYRAM